VQILRELSVGQNLIVLRKLGIIAGGGVIPNQICSACQESGRPHFVIGIQGSVDRNSLATSPHKMFRLGAIGGIITEFKKNGIEEVVIGAHLPNTSSKKDIFFGINVAKTIGDLDIGQAVVVQQGVVLGVEAAEGTKSLLCRCAGLSKKGEKGVLIKLKKSHQDPRADLPTIGPHTVLQLNQSGISGVALEAGSSLIVQREEVIRLADDFGIFVLGINLDN
jgi:DUF1009 family protein